MSYLIIELVPDQYADWGGVFPNVLYSGNDKDLAYSIFDENCVDQYNSANCDTPSVVKHGTSHSDTMLYMFELRDSVEVVGPLFEKKN